MKQELTPPPPPVKEPQIKWHLLTEDTIKEYTDYLFFAITENDLISLMEFLIELTKYNNLNNAIIYFYREQIELNNSKIEY